MKPLEDHKGFKSIWCKDAAEWRKWLKKNHAVSENVWLVIFKKESGIPSVFYPAALDEALCFGWVDSLPNKRNAESYFQFFARRKPRSNWSKVNKQKVERLMALGKMAEPGLEMVRLAKATGTWDALNEVDEVSEPQDLIEALQVNAIALAHWKKFSRSSRRGILEWILNAKKAETRARRIAETVSLAAENKKANHPQG
jgi:uncharacterized protein YdeI (YjbR/CyaY-like superfamily)